MPAPDPVSEPPALENIPNKQPCLLTPVCIGPVATLFSTLGTLGIGVRASYGDFLGASLDYQALPTINFSKFSIGTGMFSATARVYPLKGKLFVGAGFGYLHYFLRFRSDIDAEARVGVPIGLINVGFTGRSGFVFGMDAALVVPLKKMRAKVTAKAGEDAPDLAQNELEEQRADVADDINRVLGKIPILVQLNLVRIGYIF